MVLGFPGPEAGASLKQIWKTWKTWKTSVFVHGLGLRSVSLARDRSQWSLTCKFPVPFALALVWGTYIPHGDGQHTFSQTFEQTKSTRHAQ